MKRRFFCFLLAMVLLIGLLPGAQADAQPNAAVVTPGGTVTAGQTFTAEVKLSGNTDGFSNLGIEVDYNPEVLTLLSVQPGFETGWQVIAPLDKRPCSMLWLSVKECSTFNGTLATLTFQVNPNANTGSYPITVSYDKGIREDNIDGVSVNYRMDKEGDLTSIGLTYSNGSVRVKALPDTEITVSLGGRQAKLSARHPMAGQIYIASYTREGRMLDVSIRDAAGAVSAEPASGAAYVKFMWLDENRPVCAPKRLNL